MEAITLTALAVFLSPYLQKAGEKVAEKSVEVLFDARKDLAERFRNLFSDEIISLNLNQTSSPNEIAQQVAATPQIKEEVANKIVNNQHLLLELVEAFKQLPQAEFGGISINAKNIGQVINNPTGTITQTNKFS